MALRDQPYFPLYVQDFLTDKELNECSAATQGVYIKIMCIFHKCEPYGGIELKQKDKQTVKQIPNQEVKQNSEQGREQINNFALKLAKQLTFDVSTIESALTELLDEGVLKIDGDFLYQKRMVNDNKLSILRSEIGKKGGDKSLGKRDLLEQNTKQKDKQTVEQTLNQNAKQNTESENEYENEINIENKNVLKGGVGEKIDKDSILTFEAFWEMYDKKVGSKDKIKKKFDKLSKETRQKILDHVGRYKTSQPNKRFRKNPETYLNNESWNDEVIEENGNGNAKNFNRHDIEQNNRVNEIWK